MTAKKNPLLTKSEMLALSWKKRKDFYCGDTERLGLDRINNYKGHTMDNVVVCCYDCNVARSDNFTHEEMTLIGKTIKKIKSNRREKNNAKRIA